VSPVVEASNGGDMQNITVDTNGNAKTRIVNRDVNWGNDSHSIFQQWWNGASYPRQGG